MSGISLRRAVVASSLVLALVPTFASANVNAPQQLDEQATIAYVPGGAASGTFSAAVLPVSPVDGQDTQNAAQLRCMRAGGTYHFCVRLGGWKDFL